jgi:magnesium-transporting ATPase (P-type)
LLKIFHNKKEKMSDRKTPLEQNIKLAGKSYTSYGAFVFAIAALVLVGLGIFNVGSLGTNTDFAVGGLLMTVVPAICIFAYAHLTQSYFQHAYALIFVALAFFLQARTPIFTSGGPTAADVVTADRIMFFTLLFVFVLFFLFRVMPNILQWLALYPANEAAARLM